MRTTRTPSAVLTFLWFALLPGCVGHLSELDKLERELDQIGTITVKQPDVWGEARLTKHRQEFEEELSKRVRQFQEVISAHIRRLDAASFAASGAVGVGQVFAPEEKKPQVEKPEVTRKEITPAVPPVTAAREEVKAPGGLEPNELLRQQQSYIGVNQALRRINAGDDVSHLPGYAVYSMRFPISVMPGSKTKAGYRAQVTLSIRPDVADINFLFKTREAFLSAVVEAVVDGLLKERAEKARVLAEKIPKPIDPEVFRETIYSEFLREQEVKVSVLDDRYAFQFSYAGEDVNDLRRALASGEIERLRSLVDQAVHRWYMNEKKDPKKEPLSGLLSKWLQRVRPRVKKYIDRFLHEAPAAGLGKGDREWMAKAAGEFKELDEQQRLRRQLLTLFAKFDPFDGKAGFLEQCPPSGSGVAECPPGNVRFFLLEILMRSLYEFETPIYAFALDPVLEEQNALDIFSRRRDLQLAMAFALSRGAVSGKAAAEFVRRLELDIDTIALNRTVTAFNVGLATFGWVFSPRIQTPPDEPLLGHLNPVNLWTSERTRDRKRLELEPGTREVNAIVAVPAYLREVEVTATVNWIPINNPGKLLFTFSDAKELHEKARAIEKRWYVGAEDSQQWQDWGVMTGRLIALQHKVPLQRFIVRLPYDHTSSIVASIQEEGQASLAPVVADVVPNQGSENTETDVFITGANFDINSTRVIVGGQEVPPQNVELMSRRLIKAKLPKNKASNVQIYVATPWGRSNGYPFTYLQAR